MALITIISEITNYKSLNKNITYFNVMFLNNNNSYQCWSFENQEKNTKNAAVYINYKYNNMNWNVTLKIYKQCDCYNIVRIFSNRFELYRKKSFFCIYYVKKLQNLSIHPTSDDKTRPKFRNHKKKQKNRRIYRTALNNLYYLETFLENVFYIG